MFPVPSDVTPGFPVLRSLVSKLQASAAVQMRCSLFCDVTQRRVAVTYRRFWTPYWSHLHGSSSVRLLDPADCPETSQICANVRRETSQKSNTSYLLPHFVCVSISSPLSVFSCHQLNSIMTRQTGQNRTVRLFAYRHSTGLTTTQTHSSFSLVCLLILQSCYK